MFTFCLIYQQIMKHFPQFKRSSKASRVSVEEKNGSAQKEASFSFEMLQILSQSDQRLLRYHILNLCGGGENSVLFLLEKTMLKSISLIVALRDVALGAN